MCHDRGVKIFCYITVIKMGLTSVGLGSKFRVIFERIKKMTESTTTTATTTATENCQFCEVELTTTNWYYGGEANAYEETCDDCYDPTPYYGSGFDA